VLSILEQLAVRLPGKPRACEAAIRSLFQVLCRKRGFSTSGPVDNTEAPRKRRKASTNTGSVATTANDLHQNQIHLSSEEGGFSNASLRNDSNMTPSHDTNETPAYMTQEHDTDPSTQTESRYEPAENIASRDSAAPDTSNSGLRQDLSKSHQAQYLQYPTFIPEAGGVSQEAATLFQSMPNMNSFQDLVSDQPIMQNAEAYPTIVSPSQGSIDENQMLWLFDVPNLLDQQNLNFSFDGNPSGLLDVDADFNAETLFQSLSWSLDKEDSLPVSQNMDFSRQ